jgi:membrane protein DedA with SNARE-associated domain
MLTYIGLKLGTNWKNIEKYSIYLDIAAIIVIALFVIWLVYNKKNKKPTVQQQLEEEDR